MTWDSFWSGVADFLAGFWGKPAQVLVIILIAAIIRGILLVVIRRVVDRVVHGASRVSRPESVRLASSPLAAVRIVQRTRALGSVLSSVVTSVLVLVSVLLIIYTVSPQASGAFSLITAALGAGLGFGAQNIVKDVLNGLAMVSEDQLGVGDVIDSGFATGVVESVGIRTTQIRDVNGTLWYVRNGEILRIGNLSQGWARVIIDLAVPYESDVDVVQEKMLATAVTLSEDARWKPVILELPEIWGIESISAEAVVIRLVVKTKSGSKDDVARELRARLKVALDEIGVRLPALNSILLSTYERGPKAPSGTPGPTTGSTTGSTKPARSAKTARAPRTDTR